MTDLTATSLEGCIKHASALCRDKGETISFDPKYVAWQPEHLNDWRNLAKFLRIKQRMREAIDARSRKTWADQTLKDWMRKPWTPFSASK